MSLKNERMLYTTLLLLLISPPQAESFIFSAIMSAVSFAYQAYNIVNDAHDTYRKFAPQTTLDDVLNQAKKVEAKVDQIGAQLSNQISQAVDTIVTRIDDMNNIREGISKLSNGVRRIDNLYRLFELYTAKKIRLNNSTLRDYIRQVTTVGALAPKDILSDIHELIIPSSGLRESFLHYISKNLPENDTNLCGSSVPQGRIYQIFRLIMVNEIRAFTILAFTYTMSQVYECESFEGEIDYAGYELETRARDYYDVFSELADHTANSIRNCDPSGGWIKGKNFYEFERFKTKYIVNKQSFDILDASCRQGCGEKGQIFKVERCTPKIGCYLGSSCQGKVIECTPFPSPATVCDLGPGARRYQYYTSGEGETRGNDTGGCQGMKVVLKKFENCEVCQCTCVEDNWLSRGVRAFSTREQLSDVANNKVVISVKFVVMERMTHIQIQQGELLPEGRVVPDNVEWKPLEDIKFDLGKSRDYHETIYIIDFVNGTQYEMKEVEDYVLFSIDKYRINIDDLIVPPGYVVTGVKFAPHGDDKNNQPIQLGIQASPFDYESGKIKITDDNPSVWLTSVDMIGQISEYDGERSKISIDDTLNPITQTGKTILRSSPNSYIDIANTDAENDGGQTTIPLLDAQEVVGEPPFAVGGIGLYYKSISEEIAGFVAFRIFALESMKNLEVKALNKLDELKEGVTDFKGCNNEIEG